MIPKRQYRTALAAYRAETTSIGIPEKNSEWHISQVQTSSDMQSVAANPAAYVYAQITRPVNQFTASLPSTLTAQICSFQVDGTPMSAGVSVSFILVSTSSSTYTYQTIQPVVLIDNPSFEGSQGSVLAVLSGASCFTVIAKLPP